MSEYGIAAYGSMIRDRRRIDAYVQALRAALPADGVVCELGTGTGVVAFMALEAGARKVFAVEPADAIEVAREIARANNIGPDRIEFIQALSTDVGFPERADIVLSDMRGILPFLTGHFEAIADARERLLKPGGTLIAQRDSIYCGLATAEAAWQRDVGMWDSAVPGIDMSAARRITANQTMSHEVTRDELLADAALLGEIDYTTVDSPHFAGRVELEVRQAGTAHVVPVWFDTHLFGDIKLSNAPGEPLLAYGRTVFPLEEPVVVAPGDRFSFSFGARLIRNNYIHSWDTKISTPDGAVKADFRQSTFHGEALSVQSLRQAAESAHPRLNEDGRMYAFCYARFNGEHTIAEIGQALNAAFPGRFDDARDAVTWVAWAVDGSVE